MTTFRVGQRVKWNRVGGPVQATVVLFLTPLYPYLPPHLWLRADGEEVIVSARPDDVEAGMALDEYRTFFREKEECPVCGRMIRCVMVFGDGKVMGSHNRPPLAMKQPCPGVGQKPGGDVRRISCVEPGCVVVRTARGLCRNHYRIARARIAAGETTWEKLQAEGRALAPDPEAKYRWNNTLVKHKTRSR